MEFKIINNGCPSGMMRLPHHPPYGIVDLSRLEQKAGAVLLDSLHLPGFEVRNSGHFANLTHIQNALVYKISAIKGAIKEYSFVSFGSDSRRPYKINILSRRSNFFEHFDQFGLPNFPKSTTQFDSHHELYKLALIPGTSSVVCFALLSRSPQEPPYAIKVERPGGEESPLLVDYSPDALAQTLTQITGQASAADLYMVDLCLVSEQKKHCLCVDNYEGYLFGLSYTVSLVDGPGSPVLCQMEIDYRSKLIEADETFDPDEVRQQGEGSYLALLSQIRELLREMNVDFDEKQTHKLDWLKKTHAEKFPCPASV